MLLHYKKASIGWMIFEELRSSTVLIAKNLQEYILTLTVLCLSSHVFPYSGQLWFGLSLPPPFPLVLLS